MSLRTSDRRHYSALRAGFAGCAMYVTAVTVVWQPPRLDGNSLVLRPRCLKIRGIATPACALVRNDRAFSNSPFLLCPHQAQCQEQQANGEQQEHTQAHEDAHTGHG